MNAKKNSKAGAAPNIVQLKSDRVIILDETLVAISNNTLRFSKIILSGPQ